MKIAITGLGMETFAEPEMLREVAVHADRLGFSSLWMPEHIVFVEDFESKYPYARMEAMPPIDLKGSLLNPFIGLAFMAALTKRIRLCTGISLAAQYHPLLLAKILSSLDHLANGRLVLGAGLGWCREEYAALDIPLEGRARRLREYVAAMRATWDEETNDFEGEFVSWQGALSYPKPVHGRVPVFYGGNTDIALKRTAAYCDGWHGMNLTPEETRTMVERLRTLLEANGRGDVRLEICVAPLPDATPDDLEAYRDAGVDELLLWPPHYAGLERPEQAAGFLDELASRWVVPATAMA